MIFSIQLHCLGAQTGEYPPFLFGVIYLVSRKTKEKTVAQNAKKKNLNSFENIVLFSVQIRFVELCACEFTLATQGVSSGTGG